MIEVLATLGIGGNLVLAAGLLWLAFRLADAEKRAGDNGSQSERLAGKLAILQSDNATLKSALQRAQEQFDALEREAELADAAANPGDARARVLARWAAERAAAHPSAGGAVASVPSDTPAASSGPGDNLLPPGS